MRLSTSLSCASTGTQPDIIRNFTAPGAACSSVHLTTGWSTKGFLFPQEFAEHCGKHLATFLCCQSYRSCAVPELGGLGSSLEWLGAVACAEHGNRDLDISLGLSSAPCNNPECFPHLPGLFHCRSFAKGGTERIFPHTVRLLHPHCLLIPGQPTQTLTNIHGLDSTSSNSVSLPPFV